jgi:hypothetical protein
MTRALLRLALVALVGLPLAAVVGVLFGGVLSGVLGGLGYNLAVLAVGVLVSAVVAQRMLPARSLPLVPAFAVQGAHAVWLLSAVVVLRQWGGLLDVGALVGALVWLGARPTRRARNALLVVHGVEVLLLFVQYARSTEPDIQLPWLVSHLALRAAGVALTLRALETIGRRGEKRTTSSPPPPR